MTTGSMAAHRATTDAVCRSFALGWQMSDLYGHPIGEMVEQKLEDDLPGLSALPTRYRVALGLDQVDVAITNLSGFLGHSNVALPTTDAVRALLTADPINRAGYAGRSSSCTRNC